MGHCYVLTRKVGLQHQVYMQLHYHCTFDLVSWLFAPPAIVEVQHVIASGHTLNEKSLFWNSWPEVVGDRLVIKGSTSPLRTRDWWSVVCKGNKLAKLPGSAKPAMSTSSVKVVVIGCGISGISVAHKLVKSGFRRVRILEATGRSGGRIKTGRFGK